MKSGPTFEIPVVFDAEPIDTVTGESSESDPTGEIAMNPAASQEVESTLGSVDEPPGMRAEMVEDADGFNDNVVLLCWELP